MLVELLVILALIALFFIYLLAQESNREKRVEKYGEAVNKFGLMRLSGEIIVAPKYDRIDPLGELVFAASLDASLDL